MYIHQFFSTMGDKLGKFFGFNQVLENIFAMKVNRQYLSSKYSPPQGAFGIYLPWMPLTIRPSLAHEKPKVWLHH